ncbi:MAG: MinD/ParA family protein [bacterium]|nr:MinD/ParA family protein [bacterium]
MSTEIWAIGGGKGGSGKTYLTSGLAIYLAGMGKKVTLVDADLGGANLHSILRVKQPKHTLTEFFEEKIPLADIIVDTTIPNLQLITGDIHTMTPGSVKYQLRMKLYRHIKNLGGDYVLIDLGAGSALNTLDAFLMADRKIAVTLPEITSIENLYQFLKKALFRKLNVFLGDQQLRGAAKSAWKNRKAEAIKTIKHLINYFRDMSDEISVKLDEEFKHTKVHVVVNQVRHNPHIQTGFSVKSVIMKYFGIEALLVGYIEYNSSVWKYNASKEPFLCLPAGLPALEEIGLVARNIMENKQIQFWQLFGED